MLPRGAARQQQNGNIAASDRQQQPYGPEQQGERPAQLVHVVVADAAHHEHVLFWKVIRGFFGELLEERS